MKAGKKILFISYDGLTDPLGQSQIIPYICGLAKFGYKFTILSCEKKERFLTGKAIIERTLQPFSIQWIPLKYHKKPPVVSSVYDVMQLKRMVKKLHKQEKFDLVHTRPGIPALVGLWMKNRFGVKFLNDIREFFAESRVDGGMWDKNNFAYNKVYGFFLRKEEEAIAQSYCIFCLTHAAEKIIRSSSSYKKGTPLQVIPCSVDLGLFDPATISEEQKKHLRQKLGIDEDDLVISYLGSIGGWYLTDEMMRFCKMISDKNPSGKFLFISPHHHEKIYEEARKHGLQRKNVIAVAAKRSEIPGLVSLSDFSIFFIKPCFSKLSSSPTKHGELMAMGIPVITNAGVGDVKEIVERYNAGLVLETFTREEFRKVATYLSTENKFDKKLIRQGALSFYNLEKSVVEYHEIYSTLLSEAR